MFTIYEEPWGDDVTESSLSPGDQIAVRFPNNARTEVEVVSVTADEMVIRASEDGTHWLMQLATKGERALAAQVEGNPPTLQCWVVSGPRPR